MEERSSTKYKTFILFCTTLTSPMSTMNAEILFTVRIIHLHHLEQKQMVAIDTLGKDTSKPENRKRRGWTQQDHTMKLSSRGNLCISYLHREKYKTQKLHILWTTRLTNFRRYFSKNKVRLTPCVTPGVYVNAQCNFLDVISFSFKLGGRADILEQQKKMCYLKCLQ